MRENHYAILASNLKIPYVFKFKISIMLLLFCMFWSESSLNPTTKLVKSRNNKHSTGELLRLRGVFYNFSSLFGLLLLFGHPNASINPPFLRLNQLTCETPSILRSNLPAELAPQHTGNSIEQNP